jgi:methyltransferase-like protein/SAM-dependent methyltransferase
MNPPAVEHCRALELGCASGGNLIPMAQELPESELVGIDSSTRQIADGQAMIDALRLKNITLKSMDIVDVDANLGEFDYIIAHGIYSWVSTEVQDKILEVCKRHLAPNGVAYVSYNTYPGWHMLGAVRDMMRYHTRHVTEPGARAAEARVLLDFLAGSELAEYTPHGGFLHAYLNFVKEHLMPKEDAFLLHDELSEVNEPVYFYQFAEQAARHDLQYLADAQFYTMLPSSFPAEVSETLSRMAQDTVALEQYMDFLRNRTFRQTLLCHQDVRLDVALDLERLARFYVASSAVPVEPELDINSRSVADFQAVDGMVLSTDHPVTKAAMLCMAERWPEVMPFKTLLSLAQARLNGTPAQDPPPPELASDAQVLGANLLKAYGRSGNLVELHVYAPHFVLEVGECPVASPVARLQAQRGAKVTNLRHERVDLDETGHHLLPYLDGSRGRAELVGVLERLAAEGDIKPWQDTEADQELEQAGPGPQPEGETTWAEILDSKLRRFAGAALLVG